ncbi:MAG: hypothetical protein HYV63_32395 [Candidatus Schekmanbacteria bacterium]|nr:hypothetical protein [Candidatus Schekmanbacteria bacterium]
MLGYDDEEKEEKDSLLTKAYESLVPDILRKAYLLGLGSVAMTEEGLRRMISEIRLPRDEAKKLIDFLIDQSRRSKEEALSLVGSEVNKFLRTMNFEDEMRRMLSGLRIHVRAEISFERLDDESQPTELRVQPEIVTKRKRPKKAE